MVSTRKYNIIHILFCSKQVVSIQSVYYTGSLSGRNYGTSLQYSHWSNRHFGSGLRSKTHRINGARYAITVCHKAPFNRYENPFRNVDANTHGHKYNYKWEFVQRGLQIVQGR